MYLKVLLLPGVRRIEAYNRARVEELMDTIEDTLKDLKALFNNAPDLAGTIRKYIEENAGLKKQMEDFMRGERGTDKGKIVEKHAGNPRHKGN